MKYTSKLPKIILMWLLCLASIAVSIPAFAEDSTGWITKTPMPTARSGAVAGVIDGKLYVVGGANVSIFDTLQVYDPVSDSWTTKAPMHTSRYNAAAGVIDGKLYVVGGVVSPLGEDYATATLEVYDPVTDTWTTKAPMPTSRWSPAAGVINGKMYVAGGGISRYGDRTATVEVYELGD